MNSIIVETAVSKETFDLAVLTNNKVQTRKFNNNLKATTCLAKLNFLVFAKQARTIVCVIDASNTAL
ncbi:hypothetical protein OTSSIDO_0464 [Orientia tsutsugamushi str. Sido]|nr:hypothetical protein OTSSIDO_0464 [Orientia tsutsugamushi str. Sido]